MLVTNAARVFIHLDDAESQGAERGKVNYTVGYIALEDSLTLLLMGRVCRSYKHKRLTIPFEYRQSNCPSFKKEVEQADWRAGFGIDSYMFEEVDESTSSAGIQ